MNPEEFIARINQEEIVSAIREAERMTSGEIRVYVSRAPVETPVTAAQEQFTRLGMDQTRDRNGVLIYVCPVSRKFAIVGDTAVHRHCGEPFWVRLSDEMSQHFSQTDFTGGIVRAIREAGEVLRQHFPKKSDDRNELADDVEHG
jgi:uncharacterized membrane protein